MQSLIQQSRATSEYKCLFSCHLDLLNCKIKSLDGITQADHTSYKTYKIEFPKTHREWMVISFFYIYTLLYNSLYVDSIISAGSLL